MQSQDQGSGSPFLTQILRDYHPPRGPQSLATPGQGLLEGGPVLPPSGVSGC